jgi:type I restriction enzyme, S subunit
MNGEWMKSGRGEYSVSELPKGWKIATLGELGTWSSGGTPSRKNPEYYGGSIPWVKTGDLRDDYIGATEELITDAGLKSSSAKVFPAGTLLLAMYGATIGRTGVLKIDAATNQACAALIAEGLTRDLTPFLWWFFIHKADEFKAIGQGGAQPNISQAIIKDFPVALPPLNEQRRIVAKLDSLFARSRRAREELERVAGLCDRYRRSVLAAAVSGDMTQEWRQSQKLPELETVLLSEVALDFSYGSSSKSYLSGTVPVLRMGNIQNGLLDWTDLVYTSDPAEIEKYKLQEGDVLFNRTNSPELVGKTCLYKGEREAIYAGYLIRIRCSLRLLPEFLTYLLNSPAGRHYCWKVKTDGVSQSNVNAKKLGAFTFELPSVEEQKEIVLRVEKCFNAIAQLEAEYQKALKLCDRLDQAILTQAFSGKLVPQDPTDEPADVLLDRIRAEKQDLPKSKKLKSNHKPATRSLPLNSAEDRL